MKQRPDPLPRYDAEAALQGLAEAFASLQSGEDVVAFLRDLCTPAELEAMCDRWKVVPLLRAGEPYRGIHDKTGVSVTTIGRVARCLELGTGGYQFALKPGRKGAAA